MKKRVLAGLTRAQFMRRHWQKKPLLAREAFPEYAADRTDVLSRETLFELAMQDNVESRIVVRRGARWDVRHGPFQRSDFARLPPRNWTLLVQGVDQSSWQAARLMREFAFVPYARLDDVMASYAAPGGGVGPHFDSYDVFLLQGGGERRWQVSRQRDLELQPNAPVKILQRFVAEDEWIVRPGDLLYLPPQCAHHGVAIDECITYSIGFRAPAADELASRFLEYLQDNVELEGRYADPDLATTRTPGRLPDTMVSRAAAVLERVRWNRADVERFMGSYLSEPKPNVVFEPPRRPLSHAMFARRAQARGLRLALPTRMLVSGSDAYINGERHRGSRNAGKLFARLADAREIAPPFVADDFGMARLYEWYLAGYIEIGRFPT